PVGNVASRRSRGAGARSPATGLVGIPAGGRASFALVQAVLALLRCLQRGPARCSIVAERELPASRSACQRAHYPLVAVGFSVEVQRAWNLVVCFGLHDDLLGVVIMFGEVVMAVRAPLDLLGRKHLLPAPGTNRRQLAGVLSESAP